MSAPILLILRILLAIALYAFLTWVVVTLWRDLKRQSELLAARQIPPLILQPVDGGPPRRYAMPIVLIGRDSACDCLLDAATISTQHARLSHHHGQWWLEDLHSTNGTFLGLKIEIDG